MGFTTCDVVFIHFGWVYVMICKMRQFQVF